MWRSTALSRRLLPWCVCSAVCSTSHDIQLQVDGEMLQLRSTLSTRVRRHAQESIFGEKMIQLTWLQRKTFLGWHDPVGGRKKGRWDVFDARILHNVDAQTWKKAGSKWIKKLFLRSKYVKRVRVSFFDPPLSCNEFLRQQQLCFLGSLLCKPSRASKNRSLDKTLRRLSHQATENGLLPYFGVSPR
jgi:hypothetical protein